MTRPAFGRGRARSKPAKPVTQGWGLHASGRFDRLYLLFAKACSRIRSIPGVLYFTGTEVSGRTPAQMKGALGAPGWAFAHLLGQAKGECFASWDTDHLKMDRSPFARPLTDETYIRAPEYGGKPAALVNALVVHLQPLRKNRRPFWLVVLHDSTDSTNRRAQVWLSIATGIRLLADDLHRMDPDAELVIHADWNKDYRKLVERQLLDSQIAKPLRLVQAWSTTALPTGGTHGDRELIDGAMVPKDMLAGYAQLVPDDDSSDHRPFKYRVRFAKVSGWVSMVQAKAKSLVSR